MRRTLRVMLIVNIEAILRNVPTLFSIIKNARLPWHFHDQDNTIHFTKKGNVSRRRGLNPRPTHYKCVALPLSYAGEVSKRKNHSSDTIFSRANGYIVGPHRLFINDTRRPHLKNQAASRRLDFFVYSGSLACTGGFSRPLNSASVLTNSRTCTEGAVSSA